MPWLRGRLGLVGLSSEYGLSIIPIFYAHMYKQCTCGVLGYCTSDISGESRFCWDTTSSEETEWLLYEVWCPRGHTNAKHARTNLFEASAKNSQERLLTHRGALIKAGPSGLEGFALASTIGAVPSQTLHEVATDGQPKAC